MGNTLSDVFYPSNSKRQRRCEQLNNELRFIKNQFDESHGRFVDTIGELSDVLKDILVKLGYDDIKQLSKDIEAMADSAALEEWRKLQSKLDTADHIGGVISGVSTVASLGGASVTGVLIFMGTITAATGGTALAVIGVVTVLILIADVLSSAFTGGIRAKKLKATITDLFEKRLEARFKLEQMKAIENYMVDFRNALRRAERRSNSFDDMVGAMKQMHFDLDPAKEAYDRVTRRSVADMLLEEDRQKGSWTNDDPSLRARSISAQETKPEEIVACDVKVRLPSEVTGPDGKHHDLTAELHEELSHTSAVVYLKQGTDYVHVVQRGRELHYERTSKENSKFHVEFHEKHLRPTTDTGEDGDYKLEDLNVPIAVRKFAHGAVSRVSHISLHVVMN